MVLSELEAAAFGPEQLPPESLSARMYRQVETSAQPNLSFIGKLKDQALAAGVLSQAEIEVLAANYTVEPHWFHPHQPRRSEDITDIGDNLVRVYLNDIGRHPLLTKDGEQALARQREAGLLAFDELFNHSENLSAGDVTEAKFLAVAGLQAKATFVKSNLRLVVPLAKKYQASGLPLLDLIEEGNLGLHHAVDKFDWRKGFKFSTYATWWVRQAIQRGIANTSRTIRLPVHAGDSLTEIHKARDRLNQELRREPTLDEVAEDIGKTTLSVERLLQESKDLISLDEPLDDETKDSFKDIAGQPETGYDEVEHRETVTRLASVMLESLENEREKEVIILRFGLDTGVPKSLEEVGKIYDLTRERIRQIEKRALEKMRNANFYLKEDIF